MKQDVCVIIPAWNAEATIRRAVSSALAQPQAAEVVVVDDGSTDRTIAFARAADDGRGRLSVLASPTPSGPSGARNLAISATSATWICPLDADDFFRPGRLDGLLSQAADVDFVADDLILVREGAEDGPAGSLLGDAWALPAHLNLAAFIDGNVSRRGRARRELGFLKPLMRREFLEATGLGYAPELRLGEDLILYAAALARGARFKLVAACGYVAVERASSLSSRHGAGDLAALLTALRLLRRAASLGAADEQAMFRLERQLAAKVCQRQVLDAKAAQGPIAAVRVLAREPAVGARALMRLGLDGFQRRWTALLGNASTHSG